MMAEGGDLSSLSLAQLKRNIKQLSKEIYEIDLKIQEFRAQGNDAHIPALETAKHDIQKQIPQHQIQFEYKKAQNRKH